ncbi:Fe-S oxidoreductase [Rhodonellum psychrophilum GCM71 = DSM 17998]|uniref:Fe-S oxidoreductase n=2 Tax=Rhodonellum TaxID=336827 RepID=U5BRI9_9BACT|nr:MULTISPECIES: (Fe-S)-binding protein [Rhodonellum]ERM83200.1 Fe-S oxidoreductase [Rhodonellum psychrophilum GCM71 = DSM 17998]SDZ14422.1 L-lactate dehydrogenase complex protein LldE [Rhodonellum ikkaensis]
MVQNKKIALFIPCYVDQFYPQVAISTLELLEKLGCNVTYPMGQTCCGQPMANAGFERDTLGTTAHFIRTFKDYDYVVAPSGSCVLHVKEHSPQVPGLEKDQKELHDKIFEVTQFIVDVLKIPKIEGKYPHKVGYHSSCHGQRGLRLSSSSELNEAPFGKAKQLLTQLEGIEWVELTRPDECCGFGGTFAVTEEALSIQMGKDRIADHLGHRVEIMAGADMSCLMHLQGIAKRNKQDLQFKHVCEILNEALS